jgi:hypothetical protein
MLFAPALELPPPLQPLQILDELGNRRTASAGSRGGGFGERYDGAFTSSAIGRACSGGTGRWILLVGLLLGLIVLGATGSGA